MPTFNCIVPVSVRVSLDGLDLAALRDGINRAVMSRLVAAAWQLPASTVARFHPPDIVFPADLASSDREPLRVAILDGIADALQLAPAQPRPLFTLAQFRPGSGRQAPAHRWSITDRARLSMRLADFIRISDEVARHGQEPVSKRLTAIYSDRIDDAFPAVAWIVTVPTPTLVDDLVEQLAQRVTASAGTFAWVWSSSEWVRLRLASINPAFGRLSTLQLNRQAILPDGQSYLRSGEKLLFIFLEIPPVELDRIASVYDNLVSSVANRDLAPWINEPQFEEFFSIPWDGYAPEFSSETAPFHIIPFRVSKPVPASALLYLLREEAASAVAGDHAVFGHLRILNDKTVNGLPAPARAAFDAVWTRSQWSDVAADTDGLWRPGWFGAYIYAVVGPTPAQALIVRYRPPARQSANTVVRFLADEPNLLWAAHLLHYLSGEYYERSQTSDHSPSTAFEFLLEELESREGGRWFNAFFDAVETARYGELYLFVLRACRQTRYASHPRVEQSSRLFNIRRRDYMAHDYDAKTNSIQLFKDPQRRVRPGDTIAVLKRTEKRIKPERLAELQATVEVESQKLLGRILRGEDSAMYTQDDFAGRALGEAAKAIHLSKDDLEEVEIRRFMKLVSVDADATGVFERHWITIEYQDQVEDEARIPVANSRHTLSDSDFEFLVWSWDFAATAAFWNTAILIVSAISILAVAWEIGALAALVNLAGGTGAVLASIGISELIYLATARHYSVEGFLLAALHGYLSALGLRFAAGPGLWVARQIGTETLQRFVLGWIAQRITTGALGGAASSFLITFSNDLLEILSGARRGFHSLAEYVSQMAFGAALGIVTEFASSALHPLLKSLGGAGRLLARDVVDELRVNGVNLNRWIRLTSEALDRLAGRLQATFTGPGLEGLPQAFARRVDEVTILMRGNLRHAALRRVLQLKRFNLTAPADKGLQKLLSGLGGRLDDEEILAFVNRMATNPARFQQMLESLGVADDALLSSISSSAQLDQLPDRLLASSQPVAPKLLPPLPVRPATEPPAKPGGEPAGQPGTQPAAQPDAQTAPKPAEAAPAPQPAPAPKSSFKAMDDILKPDRSGFLDPVLDARYQEYAAEQLRNGIKTDPEVWARRQAWGRYRDILEKELGPDFARQGGTSRFILLVDVPRPAGLSDSRLTTGLARLRSRLDKVFERLSIVRAQGAVSGQVNAGHFNILKGNVAEVLSEPIQNSILEDIQKLYPHAETLTGIRIRLMQANGELTQSRLLFTDNLIGEFNGDNLVVHARFEVKAGARGGADANAQFFEWVEGRLTDGSELLIPGHKPLTWQPTKPGVPTVTGLASRSRSYIIAAQGTENFGLESDMQPALVHGRFALSYTTSELDYLARAILDEITP
jgi:hypothetical protein